MIGDVRFTDLIKISQIRTRPKQVAKPLERNRNFEEFTDVYKEVLNSNGPRSCLKSSYGGPTRSKYTEKYLKRPLHDIKKIRIEMPLLGTEKAIVTAPRTVRKGKTRNVETKDKALVTENQITRWGKKDSGTKPKDAPKDPALLKDTHLLLQQTKQEIDESAVQLEAIKNLINQIKPPEKIKKAKTATYKARKKPDRHAECISKKYMTTLNTMQQKLQKLEEKYFSKPHIIYKNVRDIYTTCSDVDVLYDNNSSVANDEIGQTLQGIKNELDTIANTCLDEKEERKSARKSVTFKAPEIEPNTVGDTFDEDKNIMPSNFSFKKPANFEDDLPEQESGSYSRFIDKTENWFKKHFDVFYREIYDAAEETKQLHTEPVTMESAIVEEYDGRSLTDDSDKSHDSDVDHFYTGTDSIFMDKDLQAVISSSSYLSKEFSRMAPNVKVFTNNDNYLTTKYFGASSKTNSSAGQSITDLIDNLNLSLKGSIYYKPDV